jgi:L-lactate dehydrogenase (cytochrome)
MSRRKIFKPLHPPDALDILAPEAHLGPVDPLTMPEVVDLGPTDEEKRIEQARKGMPGADAMLLIDDFEVWAEKVLSGTAWNYYRSAGGWGFTPIPLHDLTILTRSHDMVRVLLLLFPG